MRFPMKMILMILFVIVVFGITMTSCAPKSQKEISEKQQIGNTTTTSQKLQKSPTTTPELTKNSTTMIIDRTSTVVSSNSIVSTTLPSIESNPKHTTITETVATPVVGAEFRSIPLEYAKWTVIEFKYDVIHENGDNYHFPWTLNIKNDTDSGLELTAYLIHWGFHGWVGYVSETPFLLKEGETKIISGEDILGELFYEEMIFLEDIQIEVYIIEG